MTSYIGPIAVLLLAAGASAAEPIIIRASYSPKRVCVPIANGSAMMLFDEFDVKNVTGAAVRLKSIRVAIGTPCEFLKSLKKGDAVTLSIKPSEETLEQLKDRKKDGFGFLIIDGNELTLLPQKKP